MSYPPKAAQSYMQMPKGYKDLDIFLRILKMSFSNCTGWSRKIGTVKFGCIYSRGRIGFKIRLIILQWKYPGTVSNQNWDERGF